MKKCLLIFGLLLLNVSIALCQSTKVSGRVFTLPDKEPLPGANVVVKGTTTGTITDMDGKYTLEIPSGDVTLVFSFIGYENLEEPVNGRTNIEVSLSPDVISLNDVVVIGYGTIKKSDVTGSVVSVNTEAMMKKAPTNILEGLRGQAAGVMVTAQDGAPDANAAIRIRGVATINGSAKPLYVIDGVQVGDNANFLNPADIESIEVLKDASATAIYGAAGANGVIMVTTKHGKQGATHLTISADYGVQTLSRTLEVGDVDQYAKNIRTARANDGNVLQNQIFAEQYDGRRKNIDWQKEMTRVSLKQQYNISASGGKENTQSSFSLSYLNNDGIVVNTNYKRLTGRADVTSKIGEFLEFGGNVNFIHTESHGSNGAIGNNGNLSSLRDFAFMCPTMDYVDANGNIVSRNVKNSNGTYGAPMQSSLGSYDGGLTNNILAEQMENNGENKYNRALLSAYVNLKLFEGLTFKSIASYNYSTDSYQRFYGNKKRYEPNGLTPIELTGYDTDYKMDMNQHQYNNLAIESFLTYNWKNDIHNLTLMAGNSNSRFFGSYVSASAEGFPAANVRSINLTSDISSKTGSGYYDDEVRGISYFGRASYSLMDRYILTGTVRRDGSSNFGAGNRWGTFPSAALAWRLSEEDFIKNISVINNLKLRLGWGQTGNAGNEGSKAVAGLTSNTIAYYFYDQNGVAGLGSTAQTANGTVIRLVDTNLKWETNEQTNVGIDLGVLDNSLTVSADYFIRTAKDLLLDRTLRPSSGYTKIYTNYGEIQNKGIELSIDYKKQINDDFKFGVTLTGSSLKNKVITMGNDLFKTNDGSTNDGSNVGAIAADGASKWGNHSICREGYAVGSYYGYQVEGIFQSQAEVDAANAAAVAAGHSQYQEAGTQAGDFKFKDINNDGFVDVNDRTILGNGFPKVNYGLTLNASYKNFDFTVYTYGVIGQKIYSYSAMSLSNMYNSSDNGTIANLLTEASNEAWTPENHSTSLPRLSFLDNNYNRRASDKWVKKGDFFKISNIQIGYNFDKELLKVISVESSRIYFGIQNVACFSSYNKYGDPEVGQGSILYTGLDTGRYPYPRIYSVGLNLQF